MAACLFYSLGHRLALVPSPGLIKKPQRSSAVAGREQVLFLFPRLSHLTSRASPGLLPRCMFPCPRFPLCPLGSSVWLCSSQQGPDPVVQPGNPTESWFCLPGTLRPQEEAAPQGTCRKRQATWMPWLGVRPAGGTWHSGVGTLGISATSGTHHLHS